ncbi:MAG: FprA family A-type flavoprotein [Methanomassiliicoccales archaeon]|nr:FprA family A-type flavoprotein [Methanomassiliicoccales archaeon]
MKAVKIAEDVFWVGAIDWNVRNFHGYKTPKGTTYNAYLITGETNILVDTVKKPFFDQMIERIKSVIDPKDIGLIISNHVEMDHSGSLPLAQQLTGAKILASKRGVEGLSLHYDNLEAQEVHDGQEMKVGNVTLRFIETPMLHWPDSMFTFLVERGILFTMDGFGQHLASLRRFDDEVDPTSLDYESAKYYANILMPFGSQFLKTFEKVKDLPIRILATSHGIIWRKDPNKIINRYLSWAKGETKEKAVIAYDTMWGSTQIMAELIAEGIASEGVETRLFRISDSDRSEIMTEVLDARAVVIGSPTLNNSPFPTVADFMVYLKGLRPRGKIGALFGSYGWGGGAVKALREQAEKAGMIMLEDLEIQYVPKGEKMEKCVDYGKMIGKRIKANEMKL